MVCGNTQFGENSRDRIEINGSDALRGRRRLRRRTRTSSGTLIIPAGELGMPPSNQELNNIAQPAYRFTGKTKINAQRHQHDRDQREPVGRRADDRAAVQRRHLRRQHRPARPATTARRTTRESTGCGNVYVHGTYGANLTIGAANDIIVDGNLTRASSELLLGLVANNFVRVYHPCQRRHRTGPARSRTSRSTPRSSPSTTRSSSTTGPAATSSGTLNVDGAIAQYFRGPVGTTGGTGYIKNYIYNRRLQVPRAAVLPRPAARLVAHRRQSEQVPPRTDLP